MLVLNPQRVQMDGQEWSGVESIAIDRLAHRLVQEWSDDGAYSTYVDVPEQRVRVSLVSVLDDGALDELLPGQAGMLTFEAARSGSDAGRIEVSVGVVVGEVRHEVSRGRGVRSIVCWGVSSDGQADPVEIVQKGGVS
jgi:hypothetical protein